MTTFRSPPNPRRNALELGFLALAIVAIVFAALAPDAEGFVKSRREAVKLTCAGGKAPEDTRRLLGRWLFERAVTTPAGAKRCSIEAAPPTQWGPTATILIVGAAGLACFGVAFAIGPRRPRFWPRGALFGSRPFVGLVALGAGVLALAAGLRYRLFQAGDSVSEQFKAYADACTALRSHIGKDFGPLIDARNAYCAKHGSDELCIAGTERTALDNACEKFCGTDTGRKETVCDIYRLHLANREKLTASLTFETCHDVAEKQPLASLAVYASKVGLGSASTEPPTLPEAPAGDGSDEKVDGGKEGGPGGGGGGEGGGTTTPPPAPDAGRDDDDNRMVETTTLEETVRELRKKHKNLTAEQAAAIAGFLAMGLPLSVALPLGLMGGKGDDVEVTRQRILHEVETQRAKGLDPRITAANADELAEKARRDLSLRPALAQLPSTPTVERIRGTIDCGKTLQAVPAICDAKLAGVVTGHLSNQPCPTASVDRNALAALACCKCAPKIPAGCTEFLKNPSYACE